MFQFLQRFYFILLLTLFSAGTAYAQNCTVNAGTLNKTICPGEAFVLRGSSAGSGASPAVWTQIAGPTVGVSATSEVGGETIATVTGFSKGIPYTFRITRKCTDGSIVYQDATYTVSDLGTVSAGADATVCPNIATPNSTTYQLQGSPLGSGETGVWTRISGNGANPTSPNQHNSLISIPISTNITVTTYRWTVTKGSCSSYSDVTITNLGTNPNVFAGYDRTISCYNVTASILLSGSEAEHSVANNQISTWSFVSGPSIPQITDIHKSNTGVNNLIQGTYVFRWTVSGNCSNGSDEVAITVGPATQTISSAGSNTQIICDERSSVSIKGGAANNLNETVLWSLSSKTSGAANPVFSATNTQNIIVSGLTTAPNTEYVFKYLITNTQTTCTSEGTYTVRYRAAPKINIVGPSTVFLPCDGQSITLNYTVDGGTSTEYALLSAPAGSALQSSMGGQLNRYIGAPGSGTVINTFNQVGTYVLSFRRFAADGIGGCSDAYTQLTVVVSATPTPANAGTKQVLACDKTETALAGNTPETVGSIVKGVGKWTQVNGPDDPANPGFQHLATIVDPYHPTTDVKNMIRSTNGSTYTFRWIISGGDGACSNSQSDVDVIVAPPAPTVAAAGTNKSACYDTPVILEGNSPGLNEKGLWTVTKNGLAAAPEVTFSPNANDPHAYANGLLAGTPYTFKWTISNNCLNSSSNDVIITTSNLPGPKQATVEDSAPGLCLGTSATSFTLKGNQPNTAGGEVGTWRMVSGPNTPSFNAATFNTVVSSVVAGTYIFEWKLERNGCTPTTSQIRVTIAPGVTTATVGAIANQCSTEVTLTGNTPGNAGETGQWTQLEGPGGAKFDNNALPNAKVSNLKDGRYTFRWTITNNSCGTNHADVTFNVSVPPTPATVAAASIDVCNVSSAAIEGNQILVGSGRWVSVSGPSTVTFADPTNYKTTISGLVFGTYKIQWTSRNGVFCTPTAADMTINVSKDATATAVNGNNYCNVSTVELRGTSGSTGSWIRTTGTGADPTITQNGASDAIVTGLVPGTHTFRYSYGPALSCGVQTADVTITITPPPSQADAGVDYTSCKIAGTEETSVQLDAAVPAVGTGTWSVKQKFLDEGSANTTVNFSSLNDPKATISNLSPGVYFLEWKVVNGNCTGSAATSDFVRITVSTQPVSNAGSDQAGLCSDNVKLDGNVPNAGSGTWSIVGGTPGGVTFDAVNDPKTKVFGLTPGTYTFRWTVTAPNSKCQDAVDDVQITVASTPPQNKSNAGNDQVVCVGNTVYLAGNALSGAETGKWTFVGGNGGGTIVNDVNNNATITGLAVGTYKLLWTISNGAACTSADEMQVTVNPAPSPATITSPDQVICLYAPLTLTTAPITQGTGSWEVLTKPGTTDPIFSINGTQTNVFGLGVGTYTLRYVVSSSSCADTKSSAITITVTSPPTVSAVDATPRTICYDTFTTLPGNSPTTGTGTWSVVSGPATYTITNPNLYNSTFKGIAGKYILQWEITGAGCASTATTVEITVEPQIIPGVLAASKVSLCSGGSNNISIKPAASTGGGTGTRTYQWQVSTTSAVAGFTDITGETGLEFQSSTSTYANSTAGAIPKSYWFRRVDMVGQCNQANSPATNVVEIEVLSQLKGNAITAPTPLTFCDTGVAPVFGQITGGTITGGSGSYNIKWQRSNVTNSSTPGSSYTDIPGANGLDYTPGSEVVANTSKLAVYYHYRRVVTSATAPTGGTCGTANSNVVSFVVNPTPVISAKSVTICSGGTVALSFVGDNVPANTQYSWVIKTNNPLISGQAAKTNETAFNETLTNAAPTNTPQTIVYTVTPKSSAALGSCVGNTFEVTVTVHPIPVINNLPATTSYCSGTAVVFDPVSPTTGATSSTFAWARTTNASITSSGNKPATTGTGKIDQILTNSSDNIVTVTYTYDAKIDGTDCVKQLSFSVDVNPKPRLSNLTSPQAEVCYGSTFSYTRSVPTQNQATGTYSWKRIANAGYTSSDPLTGTGNIPAQSLVNITNSDVTVTYEYTLNVNGCENVETITVVLLPQIIPGAITTATTPLCTGVTSNNISITGPASTGGTGTRTYQWQVSTTSATTGFTNISGATSNNFAGNTNTYNNSTAGAAPKSYWFRRIDMVGVCDASKSPVTNAIEISVLSDIKDNKIKAPTDITLCETGSAPVLGKITNDGTISGGSGSFSYSWQRSTETTTATPSAGSFTINITGPNAVSADYTPGDGAGDALASNATLNPVYYHYRRIATSNTSPTTGNCGTSVSNVITFTIKPVPAVNNLTKSICPGSVTVKPVNVTDGRVQTGTTYSWGVPTYSKPEISGGSASTGSPIEIVQTLANSSTSSGTATYTITPTYNGCAGKTFTLTITVKPTPKLNSGLTPAAICNNTTFSYEATSLTTGTTFSWTRPIVANINGGVAGSGSSSTISETLINSTTAPIDVTYKITMSADGCDNTQDVVVRVNPTPVLTSTLTPAAKCDNIEFDYTAASSTIGTTFKWSRDAVTGISNAAANGTGANIKETLRNTTTAPVTVNYKITLSANGCDNVQTVSVVIYPVAKVTSVLTPAAICNGDSFEYTPTTDATGGTNTFKWSRAAVANINAGVAGTGGTLASGGKITETLTNSSTNSINVVYVVTPVFNGCDGTPSNVTVTVNPTPKLNSGLTPAAICNNTNFTYEATSATTGTTFTWTRAVVTGISNLAGSGSTKDISETLINTTTAPIDVTYKITSTANGCANTENVVVSVKPTPVLTSSLTPTVCSDNSFSYTATSLTTGTTFKWERAAITGISNVAASGNSASISETLINTTVNAINVTYKITLTADGCDNIQNVVVTVYPRSKGFNDTYSVSADCSGSLDYDLQANLDNITNGGNGMPAKFKWTVAPNSKVTGQSDDATVSKTKIVQTLINLSNTAQTLVYTITPVGSTEGQCDGYPFTLTVTVPVCSKYEVTKTAKTTNTPDDEVKIAGNVITYTIVVKNTGHANQTNVSLTDPFLVTGGNPTGSISTLPVYTAGNNNVTLEKDEIWTYSYTYTTTQADIDNNGKPFPLIVSPSNAGKIVNTVSVTTTELPTAKTAEATIKINALTGFTVTKTSDVDPLTGITTAGQTVNYTVKLANTSATAINTIAVSDPMLSGLAYKSGDAVPLGILNVGETWTYEGSYVVKQSDIDKNGNAPVAHAGKLYNIVTASGKKPDGTGTGDITDEVEIPIKAVSSFTVTKTTTVPAVPITAKDDKVPYVIEVKNTGKTAITNVVLTDALVGGLTRVSQTGGTGDNTDEILNVGETWKYTPEYTVPQSLLDDKGNPTNSNTLVNEVLVDGKKPDGTNLTQISATATTPVTQNPAVTLSKKAVAPFPTKLGDDVNYEIVVTNSGNVTLYNLVVSDVNATVTGSAIGTLIPGATKTITAKHPVTKPDITAQKVENQAEVDGNKNKPAGDPINKVSDNPETPTVPNDKTVVSLLFPPYANNDESLNHAPGTTVTLNLLTNDQIATTDPALPAATQVDLDLTTAGIQTTLVVTGKGTWTYDVTTGNVKFVPVAGYTVNPPVINYRLIETATALTADATIKVTYKVEPPLAANDSKTGLNPGSNAVLNVLTNDKLSDGSAATAALSDVDLDLNKPGTQHVLEVKDQGKWTYDPATGNVTFDPEDGFTIDPTPIDYDLIEKLTGKTSKATITLNYVKLPPVATNDSQLGIVPGVEAELAILNNDAVADGTTARARLVDIDLDLNTPGVQHELVVTAEGKWTYNVLTGVVNFKPNAGFTIDPTPINYQLIENHTGLSAQAKITVTYVRLPPDAVNDFKAGTAPGASVEVDLFANDKLADKSIVVKGLVAVDLNPATSGINDHSITVPGEGTWTYDPTTAKVTFVPVPGFTIDPTPIEYELTEIITGLKDKATITVSYTKRPPVPANDQSDGNTPGKAVSLPLIDNDHLSDGSLAALSKVTFDIDVNTPGVQTELVVSKEGKWTLNTTTGIVTFTPEIGFTISPTPIPYTLTEKITGLSADATITITYTIIKPIATNDSSIDNIPGTTVIIDLLSNDKIADGSIANPGFTSVDLDLTSPGIQTTRTVVGEGKWTYDSATGKISFVPNPGFTVDPTVIPYQLIEVITGKTDDATITVKYKRLPPDAADDFKAGTAPGAAVVVNLFANDKLADKSDVLKDLVLVDLDPTTTGINDHTITVPGEGSWTYNPTTGQVTFVPVPGFTTDPTPVKYVLTEIMTGLKDQATITVSYSKLPPNPANDVSNGHLPGTNASLNILLNDKLSDGSAVTIPLTSVDLDLKTAGIQTSLTVPGEGVWTYEPATGVVTFDPNPGFALDPTPIFYQLIEKSTGLSADASITITYKKVTPDAVDDESNGNKPGMPASVNILQNDKLSDGSAATPGSVTADIDLNTPGIQTTLVVPGEGQWVYYTSTGVLTFTPRTGYNTDPTPIQYTLRENNTGLTDNATVKITYVRVAPDATDDFGSSATPGVPPVVNILTNDKLSDGSPANVTNVTIDLDLKTNGVQNTLTVPGEGVWTYNSSTGNVIFTPNPGFIKDPTPIPYRLIENITGLSDDAVITMKSTVNLTIGLAKSVSTVRRELNGSETVTYLFTVKNYGNVPLANVSIIDNLKSIFQLPMEVTVRSILASGTLMANNSYNGAGVDDLLTAASTLPVGKTETVRLVVNILANGQYGTYNNTARATATGDQVGGTTTDISTDGTDPDPSGNFVPSDINEDKVTPITLTGVDMVIPEGFSPNGDGINDKLVIENLENKRVDLEIYNRWGNIVYKNKNYKNDWDGICNAGIYFGQVVPDGTYYYIVKLDGESTGKVKFITINR